MKTSETVARGPVAPKQDLPRDRIRPCFFSAGGDPLYACHHFPSISIARTDALLLCNSVLHEYERTHRALRQIAIQAARRGVHAMRFDYFGTGDSAGDCSEVSFARWRRDVSAALDECLRISTARRASVFGIRLGATLALEAAAARDDVDTLILYAPIFDSGALVREWRRLAQASAARPGELESDDERSATEIQGFPLTIALQEELLALVPTRPNPSLRRVLVLATGTDVAAHDFVPRLQEYGAEVTLEHPAEASIWQHDPMEAMVPFKLLRRIVAWLEQRS